MAKREKQSSELLQALRFVRGSSASSDYSPILSHYAIADRRIRGYNGWLALCCPIQLDLCAKPNAAMFAHAIEACEGAGAQLSLDESGGALTIHSGDLTVHVPCLTEPYPSVAPSGRSYQLGGGILQACKTLAPFTAEDNIARQWAAGIQLTGSVARATNSMILAEFWLGFEMPCEVGISSRALKELMRIGEEPLSLQVDDGAITFHFNGGRWLRASVNPGTWPDVSALLPDRAPPLLPPGLFEAVDRLAPFSTTGEIRFFRGCVGVGKTTKDGATVDIEGLPDRGSYSLKQLQKLAKVATHADFSLYPSPAHWAGYGADGAHLVVRGALAPMVD